MEERVRRAFAFTLVLLCVACSGHRVQAPTATRDPGRPPDLTGVQVLFFPVQRAPLPGSAASTVRYDGVDQLDAEISYWLREQAPDVRWVLPEAIDRTLRRNPELDIKVRQLDVAAFRRAQVKRIGDPLFGDLRRLAAVLNARLALIPVAAESIGRTEGEARVQVATAIIDALDGTVLWFGITESEADASGPEAGLASVAQVMARQLGGRRTQEMQNR